MQNILKDARDETNRLNWLKTGVVRVNKVVLGQTDITTLASKVINEIADYLDAKVGAIYIASEVGSALELSLIGSFAYTHRKNLSSQFKLGEGLVGQSALERKQILLDNVPEDYIRVSSGLGDTVPRNICVTPMLFEQTLEGVLEIATLVPLKPIELEYLRLVIEAVAMAFEIAKTQSSMQSQQVALLTSNEELEAQIKIVALSQQELKAQQSELEKINAELEAQMQRVKDSEDELKAQQEELEIANVELKSKNSLLEQQKGTNEQARQELATQAEELTLASKYKSEFLANMSHELRTPLNSLLLLARSLTENRTGNLSEDQVETAGVIYDSGSDLLNLINEILDLSKIESGKMELRLQPVDIKSLMRTINIQFEHMAKNQGLTLNTTCDEQLPRSITTDAQRLGQVIKNLVGNALKFTEHGSVSVAFTQIPAGTDLSRSHLNPSLALAIRVTDTGIGIPLDKQKIIFEAFQQADSGDRRRFGGTGLGLSISRELVSLLGGEIQLESEPGKGSTFSIYIPIKVLGKEPIVLDEMIQAESKHSLTAPIKIAQKATTPLLAINVDDDREALSDKDRVLLIIEDDLRFAKILAGNIRERGFKCLIALSGEEGLELATQHRPDGIVLDIHLPNIRHPDLLDFKLTPL